MRVKIILSGFLLLIGTFGCAQSPKKYSKKILPKDLNSAMAYIDTGFNTIDKARFRMSTEKDAVAGQHFSIGLWIRNNWILGDRDSALVNYFHHMGIYNPDDISAIILTSLYRKLNNKPINLGKQIDYYIAYWKGIDDCEQQSTKQAVKNYNRFQVGDPIKILMYVDTSGIYRNATTFICPASSWKFDPKKDLLINGVVIKKYTINSADNVFFKIQIKKMNFPATEILTDTVKVGDIKDFSLDHLKVVKNS